MEQLFAQFMHIYFWVFIVIAGLSLLDYFGNIEKYKKQNEQHPLKIRLAAVVAISLFIMSFGY